MQRYLQEFDKQYKGKKYIEIEFCNDEPLTKKYVRYKMEYNLLNVVHNVSIGKKMSKESQFVIELGG